MSRDDDRKDDEALLADVARAFVARGELPPTTEAEVLAAEDDGVEFEGDLPEALATFRAPKTDEREEVGALSRREEPKSETARQVVSLDDARRARDAKRGVTFGHVMTFAFGAAVAAGAMLVMRPTQHPSPREEPGSGAPGTTASAVPSASSKIEIGPVSHCQAGCCAGVSCGTAQGELRSCASGRSCVACGDATSQSDALLVRVGTFSPTDLLADEKLDALDVCGRVPSSEWSCVPLRGDPGATARARSLSLLVSPQELAAGLEIQLRNRNEKSNKKTDAVVGHWRDSVRLGPTVLCRGVGALVVGEKDEHLGSLSLFLDETHYVEIERSDDALALLRSRGDIALADETPALFETTTKGHFALAVGPLDKATAEQLRWALLEKGRAATVVLGADYRGEPKALP